VLAVTEIMYHPPEINGTDLEFLEIKNTGTNTLNLSGVMFANAITFGFTNNTLLAPGQFFVLASDAAEFARKYPGVAAHGVYSGQLNNDGETLTLNTSLGTPIFSVTYGDRAPWPVAPDGFGFSLVPKLPGTARAPDDGTKWRASANAGGSPGTDDPPPGVATVVINEILTASEPPQTDSIELLNTSEVAMDISGWFLTDDAAIPKKFRIADGTVLAGGGFAVFTEADFNPTPGTNLSFSLSAGGDQVYLFSARTNGPLTGYSHGVSFAGAARGVSFGRHVNSAGEETFPAQESVTPASSNSGPRVGPAVLSEIMYHPPTGGVEYIEIQNITEAPLRLFDPAFPTNTWRLSGADFNFPTNFTLPPRGLVVIARTNASSFRTLHALPASVPVLGPFPGTLQDSGERCVLQRPDILATNEVIYIDVDAVRYNDRAPWPAAADGSGSSLHRLGLNGYGNEPAHWLAAAPSPGSALDQDGDGLADWWELAHHLDLLTADAGADPDGDGQTNLAEFLAGTDPQSAASALRLRAAWSAHQVALSFNAVPGRAYALQTCGDLAGLVWTNAAEWSAALETRLIEWTTDAGLQPRFFRVMVLPPDH